MAYKHLYFLTEQQAFILLIVVGVISLGLLVYALIKKNKTG
jgi:hypothetical protein